MSPNDVTHHRHHYNSKLATAASSSEEDLLLPVSAKSATTKTMPPSNNKHHSNSTIMDNHHSAADLELQLDSSTTATGTHHRHHHHHNKGGVDDDEHQQLLSTIEMSSNGSSNINSDDGGGMSNNVSISSARKSLLLLLGSAANVKAFTACLLYSFCSVSMVLTNKSLTSSYSTLYVGDLNILLVVFQAMVAVVSVHFCKTTGIVEDYPPVTVGTLRAWAGVNVLFCLMLFTGMVSLQYNSVPMVTVFKNVANIFTATGDYIVFGNESGKLAMAAFAVMLFGAMAAASKDIECTSTGLFWMMANCLATSGYVLYMKHATLTVKTTKFGMVFLNNVLCVIFLLPVAFMFGEVSIFYQSKGLHSMDYFIKNLFAGFVGFFLNFASLNCVQATGPTTYAIVGSVNKIPVAFLGYLLFDNMITPDTWFFISVSMCGGFLYSFASLRSSSSSK